MYECGLKLKPPRTRCGLYLKPAIALTNIARSRKVHHLSAELLKISPEAPEPAVIRYAADLIKRGELVAVPTDTF